MPDIFPNLPKLSQKARNTFSALFIFKYFFLSFTLTFQDKEKLSEENLDKLEEITKSSEIAQEILEASRSSVGQISNEVDMKQIVAFCQRIIK